DPFLSKAVLSKIKAARELHGRVVHCPANKAAPERWGVVTYKGDECRPKYFRITFQDGSTIDDLQHAVLLRKGWLMPQGSELPRHLAASTVTAATLPDHWLLSSTAGVLAALHCLLPGSWHPSVAAAIAQGYQLMQPTSITPQELRVASTVINLGLMHNLLDPCTTTPIIISGLELQPLSAQPHLSLSPTAYRAQLQRQPIDAIISCPDPTILDLLLPLAVIYAHSLVCMLVPHAYLSDAPPARFRWLQQLKAAERLLYYWLAPNQYWLAPNQYWLAPNQYWLAPNQYWLAPNQYWLAPNQYWLAPNQYWLAPNQYWLAPNQYWLAPNQYWLAPNQYWLTA
ncbi:hypothetical protein QJQ45_007971, partial [Haematococcus lacustris]